MKTLNIEQVIKYSLLFLALLFVLAILTPEPKTVYNETQSCTIAKENNEVYEDIIYLDAEAFDYIGGIFNNIESYLLDYEKQDEAVETIENFGSQKTYLLNQLQ